MILYSLACEAGHRFESWFGNSAAFDTLAAQGALACPACGSSQVAKTIMAPAVVANRSANRSADRAVERGSEPAAVAPDVDAPAKSEPTEVALLDDGRKEIRSMVKALRDKILAGTQDVGAQFPDEARRMHDGEIPHREIRGQATVDEARSLLEDGILILPVPTLPGELN